MLLHVHIADSFQCGGCFFGIENRNLRLPSSPCILAFLALPNFRSLNYASVSRGPCSVSYRDASRLRDLNAIFSNHKRATTILENTHKALGSRFTVNVKSKYFGRICCGSMLSFTTNRFLEATAYLGT